MNIEDRVRALEAKVARLEEELTTLRGPDIARRQSEQGSARGSLLVPPQAAGAAPLEGAYPPSYGEPGSMPPQAGPGPSGGAYPSPYGEPGSVPPHGGPEPARPLQPGYGQRPATREPAPATDWEQVARVWLPRVFVVVLLLGVVWGFTAAVTAGYINEPVRCLLGVLAAGLMYGLGERQIRGGRDALGQVLVGGAVAILILAGFAAYTLYELIPALLAAVYYAGTVALGVFAALRHRSESLIMIAMVAGYLLPVLLTRDSPDPWLYIGYEALFSVAMLTISAKFGFRFAYGAAFGLLHLPLVLYASYDYEDQRLVFLLAVVLQHLALYALMFLYRPAKEEMPPAHRQAVLFTGFMVLAAWLYAMYGTHSPGLYSGLLGAATILHGATAYMLYKRRQPYAVFGVIASVGVTLWLFQTVQFEFLAGTIVLQGAAAVILGLHLRNKLQLYTGLVIYGWGAFTTIITPITTLMSGVTLGWMLLLATLPLLYKYRTAALEEGQQPSPSVQLLMWAEALLLLYFITRVTQLLTVDLTGEAQRLIVSGIWIIYAIAVVVTGIFLEKAKVRLAGVAFLFLTLIKIIFVDLPDVSPAIRAVLFIFLGAAGIAASRLLYRRKE
ncbi:DUF2339 domain-containing protein [Paenibacillus sp. 1P07SE]|uniref:DUF2339 domain-containing protein n=1 Tax=Paenibacillus sp. 1P07SE TaxID=3132209 RepID=UPI0039A50C11